MRTFSCKMELTFEKPNSVSGPSVRLCFLGYNGVQRQIKLSPVVVFIVLVIILRIRSEKFTGIFLVTKQTFFILKTFQQNIQNSDFFHFLGFFPPCLNFNRFECDFYQKDKVKRRVALQLDEVRSSNNLKL